MKSFEPILITFFFAFTFILLYLENINHVSVISILIQLFSDT